MHCFHVMFQTTYSLKSFLAFSTFYFIFNRLLRFIKIYYQLT